MLPITSIFKNMGLDYNKRSQVSAAGRKRQLFHAYGLFLWGKVREPKCIDFDKVLGKESPEYEIQA